ncbi:MAG TPA: N,N-dimethylformamidase beta subunit family domain-containing protein [Candidatus Bathyarchaeia archaeon]|nr:N,N-dimethylformamidase beta subunit family domain-containing protein [Candidatus Bathyarchaeia archaeon]
MKKSVLTFIVTISAASLIIATLILPDLSRTFFLFNNKSNFISRGPFVKGPNIALIKPTFTGAAYHSSFYKFYFIYVSLPHVRKNVTTNLNLLSSKVTNQTNKSSSSYTFNYLPEHLKTIFPNSNIDVLTDADADYGSIFFNNGTNKYDVVILGHQEYETQREYDNLKRFVANGGTMILMDGNVFYAQVKYNRNTHTITLVKGHGWAFNGKSAWRSVGERWPNETSQWAGSNYLCYSCKITFANNPFHYKHHEEQYLTNPKDLILLNYDASITKKDSKPVKILIATFTLNYKKGKVIAIGIYSDDIITNKKFIKYFDSLLLRYTKV